jgi:ATP-dependent Clp protease ATP-binding subunit ClpA
MSASDSIEQLLSTGQTQQAIADAQRWVQASPMDAQAHSTLARALFYGKNHGAAISAAERATKLDPQDPSLWARLGGLYVAGGRLADARHACESALRLDAQHPMALVNLAQTLLTLELRSEATAVLQTLTQLQSLEPAVAESAQGVAASLLEGDALARAQQQIKAATLLGADSSAVRRRVREARPRQTSVLQTLGRNLTELAARGELDPVAGREAEIDAMLLVLSRKKKANPCLVGPAGVGKTACVEGLAQRLVRGDVPASLRDARVFELSMAALFAGSSLRGELESRVQALLAEVRADRSTILFLDELHTLVPSQGSQGELAVAEMLKPALARGELALIGATTADGYERSILRDPALARRFERIAIEQPRGAPLLQMLHAVSTQLQEHHRVVIDPELVSFAVAECARWLPERAMPDAGADVLDRAAAMAANLHAKSVTQGHLKQAIASMALSRTEQLYATIAESKARLQAPLALKLLGQDTALRALVDAYALGALHDDSQPRCVLWLYGPDSVGKHTAIAELARSTERPLIRYNLAVLAERHDSTRLLGAPAGYTGYDDGSTLTRALRAAPNAVLCLDAPEHAHPEVQALIAQALTDGAFVDSHGWRAELRRACVVLVSDLKQSSPAIGYAHKTPIDLQKHDDPPPSSLLDPSLYAAIDRAIAFRPLAPATLERLAHDSLTAAMRRMDREAVRCELDTELVARWVVSKTIARSTDARGARDVLRAVIALVVQPLLQAMVDRSAGGGATVLHATLVNDTLQWS